MSWLVLAAAGCARQKPAGYQGYLEGELVYVAAPLAGRLETLASPPEHRSSPWSAPPNWRASARRADRLRAAQARLEDLKKGARPSELAALEARLEQARSAAELSQRELARQETLFKSGASPANDLDRARLTHERNTRAIDGVAAQLGTAQLGGRTDWNVEQKSQSPAQPALVYDTLFHPG